MRILAPLVLVMTLLFAGTASAQNADAGPRLQLAERYIELSLGDNVSKMVAQMVEEELASNPDMSDRERRWMRANLPVMVLDMINGLARDLAPVYAQAFTIEELESLVTYYSSPIGQAVAAKQFELGAQEQVMMEAALLGFFEAFVGKYCREFDCDDAFGGEAVKR